MKTSLKLSLITGLLVAAGFAYSQGPQNGQCDFSAGGPGMQGFAGHHEHMGRMDPARMQARIDQRNAALKVQLKITPAQEAAWTAYTAVMKLSAGMLAPHPERAEMAKLTTPERLDQMKALHTQRLGEMTAAMDKHAEVTKALYAALTPEQQKQFDAAAARGMGHLHGQYAGKAPVQPQKQ